MTPFVFRPDLKKLVDNFWQSFNKYFKKNKQILAEYSESQQEFI